ncbi:S-adenosylmethionine sensor upstream of mTORC1 [Onthophagus taurus]|uniref:S-adenosylmethionine sensor upstream of mTORC1 n=1 Tax=Onthophagus taurus TaxID=166361 RepID=UPI0039BEC106
MMASEEHIQLSDFIKKVHQNLRVNTKVLGSEEAWKQHCENNHQLERYAESMKVLATKFWSEKEEKTTSRILWTLDLCTNYFNNLILNLQLKEYEIAQKINLLLNSKDHMVKSNQLKLLDVGSCYNPFKEFDLFDVTAIDLAPALPDVLQCDFINLKICEITKISNNTINSLAQNSFHVIVFSLLLEYLPTPEFRFICCEKAYKLLKPEGLLIIITPDSNHVGVNAKLMKTWRFILAQIGFSRIKYEKLKHLHCMGFRKSLAKETSQRWANIYVKNDLYDKIYIPQDLNKE